MSLELQQQYQSEDSVKKGNISPSNDPHQQEEDTNQLLIRGAELAAVLGLGTASTYGIHKYMQGRDGENVKSPATVPTVPPNEGTAGAAVVRKPKGPQPPATSGETPVNRQEAIRQITTPSRSIPGLVKPTGREEAIRQISESQASSAPVQSELPSPWDADTDNEALYRREAQLSAQRKIAAENASRASIQTDSDPFAESISLEQKRRGASGFLKASEAKTLERFDTDKILNDANYRREVTNEIQSGSDRQKKASELSAVKRLMAYKTELEVGVKSSAGEALQSVDIMRVRDFDDPAYTQQAAEFQNFAGLRLAASPVGSGSEVRSELGLPPIPEEEAEIFRRRQSGRNLGKTTEEERAARLGHDGNGLELVYQPQGKSGKGGTASVVLADPPPWEKKKNPNWRKQLMISTGSSPYPVGIGDPDYISEEVQRRYGLGGDVDFSRRAYTDEGLTRSEAAARALETSKPEGSQDVNHVMREAVRRIEREAVRNDDPLWMHRPSSDVSVSQDYIGNEGSQAVKISQPAITMPDGSRISALEELDDTSIKSRSPYQVVESLDNELSGGGVSAEIARRAAADTIARENARPVNEGQVLKNQRDAALMQSINSKWYANRQTNLDRQSDIAILGRHDGVGGDPNSFEGLTFKAPVDSFGDAVWNPGAIEGGAWVDSRSGELIETSDVAEAVNEAVDPLAGDYEARKSAGVAPLPETGAEFILRNPPRLEPQSASLVQMDVNSVLSKFEQKVGNLKEFQTEGGGPSAPVRIRSIDDLEQVIAEFSQLGKEKGISRVYKLANGEVDPRAFKNRKGGSVGMVKSTEAGARELMTALELNANEQQEISTALTQVSLGTQKVVHSEPVGGRRQTTMKAVENALARGDKAAAERYLRVLGHTNRPLVVGDPTAMPGASIGTDTTLGKVTGGMATAYRHRGQAIESILSGLPDKSFHTNDAYMNLAGVTEGNPSGNDALDSRVIAGMEPWEERDAVLGWDRSVRATAAANSAPSDVDLVNDKSMQEFFDVQGRARKRQEANLRARGQLPTGRVQPRQVADEARMARERDVAENIALDRDRDTKAINAAKLVGLAFTERRPVTSQEAVRRTVEQRKSRGGGITLSDDSGLTGERSRGYYSKRAARLAGDVMPSIDDPSVASDTVDIMDYNEFKQATQAEMRDPEMRKRLLAGGKTRFRYIGPPRR